MALNDRQQQVARARGDLPLKVIAGAGTGKTETLAARFVALVEQGVPPDRILLLTFTEEAAAEMRARVMRRLAEARPDAPPFLLADLWCHTFHGFAMRLLRQYGWDVGLSPAPRLLDEEQRAMLLDNVIATWEETYGNGPYRPFDHMEYTWEDGEVWRRVRGVLDRVRGSGGSPAELQAHERLREQQDAKYATHRAQLVPLIEHMYATYEAHLAESGLLDHDEQIARVCRLLVQMPEQADRFDVIMIDEFQDTNRAQLALLEHLCSDWSRVTVVGDPRQAIYGWRAARPDSLRQFPYRPHDASTDQALQQNYRSRDAICRVANLALLRSEFEVEAPLEPGRDDATGDGAAAVVGLHLLPTVGDEAAFVAAEMRRLLDAGARASDLALLLRARTHLPAFLDALEQAGVPYRVNGGSGFFRQPAVRLLASLLGLLLDPEDRNAAVHVLESPLVGLDLRLLVAMPGVEDRPWWRWLDEPQAVPPGLPGWNEVVRRLEAFGAFFRTARARALLDRPGDLLLWLVNASGLRACWQDNGQQQALRDADKLVALAHAWQQQEPELGLAGYVARLRKQIDEQPRESVPVEYATDVVDVATVHAAKGREWPVVFVADTALPSTRASQVEHVLWDEHWGLIISDGNAKAKSKGPDPLSDLRRDLRRRARNEERAIWYVALTRARDRLVITHSRCEVDQHGRFSDAISALAPDEADENPVHFFHELWEHVRTADDPGGEIYRGPGPCSGMIVETAPAVVERAATRPSITPWLRTAWEQALDPAGLWSLIGEGPPVSDPESRENM